MGYNFPVDKVEQLIASWREAAEKKLRARDECAPLSQEIKRHRLECEAGIYRDCANELEAVKLLAAYEADGIKGAGDIQKNFVGDVEVSTIKRHRVTKGRDTWETTVFFDKGTSAPGSYVSMVWLSQEAADTGHKTVTETLRVWNSAGEVLTIDGVGERAYACMLGVWNRFHAGSEK